MRARHLFTALLFLLPAAVFAQPPLPEVPTPTFNVRLSWTAPTTNTDGTSLTNLAGYKVSYARSVGNWTVIDVPDADAVMHVLTENVLQSDTQYYFAVQAINTQGVLSAYSNIAGARTPDVRQPGAPRDVVVEIVFNAGL